MPYLHSPFCQLWQSCAHWEIELVKLAAVQSLEEASPVFGVEVQPLCAPHPHQPFVFLAHTYETGAPKRPRGPVCPGAGLRGPGALGPEGSGVRGTSDPSPPVHPTPPQAQGTTDPGSYRASRVGSLEGRDSHSVVGVHLQWRSGSYTHL